MNAIKVSARTGNRVTGNAVAVVDGVEGAGEVDMMGIRLCQGCHYIPGYLMRVAGNASIPI
jgi:hypothetical protein